MKAIGISPGIVLGKVLVHKETELVIDKREIKDVEGEIRRLKLSIKKATEEIDELYDEMLKTVGKQEAAIFSAHKMILNDPDFIDKIKSKLMSIM